MPITTPNPTVERGLFDDKIQQAVNHLNDRYIIRIPVQDPSKIQVKFKNKESDFDPDFDYISLDLISEGLAIGDNILRKILRSPHHIRPINPIKEYFDGIRGKFAGTSQIDALISYIQPRIFSEDSQADRLRMEKIIKKWIVCCVAEWVGERPHDVSLGIICGDEGIGKTKLIEFLIPDTLKEYFTLTSRDEKRFDMEDAFTRYMLINFDELEGLSGRNIDKYKKCQSSVKILNKRRHEEFPTHKLRIGVTAFTTNRNQEKGGFLLESYGYRRFGAIEVTNIDWKGYTTNVDIDQLWAEALLLYEESEFEYEFTQPDFMEFAAYNQRYLVETDAMKCVSLHISRPETDEEGEQLNATEILQRLVATNKLRKDDLKKVTTQTIGSALMALGFKKVSYRDQLTKMPLKGYHVKFNE